MIFLVILLTKKTKQNFFKEYLIIHYMNTLLVFFKFNTAYTTRMVCLY